MNIDQLKDFLFWWMIVDLVVYIITVLALFAFRDLVGKINSRVFGISGEEIRKSSFNYVAHYKLLLIVFNFAPWIALVILTNRTS